MSASGQEWTWPSDVIEDIDVPAGLLQAKDLSKNSSTSTIGNQSLKHQSELSGFWKGYVDTAANILRSMKQEFPEASKVFPVSISVDNNVDGDGRGSDLGILIGWNAFWKFSEVICHESGHILFDTLTKKATSTLRPKLDAALKKLNPISEFSGWITSSFMMTEVYGDAPVFSRDPEVFAGRRPVDERGIAFTSKSLLARFSDGSQQYEPHHASQMIYSLLIAMKIKSQDADLLKKWYRFVFEAINVPELYKVCWSRGDRQPKYYMLSPAKLLDRFQQTQMSAKAAKLFDDLRGSLNATSEQLEKLEALMAREYNGTRCLDLYP